MAVYEYQAIAKSGKTVKGVIDADTAAAARRRLREQELYPTRVTEGSGAELAAKEGRRGGFGRVGVRDIALMTRQVGTLLHAGMPLVEALSALLDQVSKPRLAKAVYDIRDRVNAGSSLASALGHHPRIFSDLYVNMVDAGEASGTLESVLFRLAEALEHQARLKARLLSTLAYPVFMALFAVGVIAFLVVVIVPRITQIFEKQEQELPKLTKALIGTSDFVGHYWWIMMLSVLGVFSLWRLWVSRPSGRLAWDRFKFGVPGYGGLYRKLLSARFARTLGTMLQSGLTMLVALDVVKTVVGNRHIDVLMDGVRSDVRRGKNLAVALKDTGVFPPMMLHMVDLGQRSGEMEDMLIRVADTYDDDVRMAIDALVGLLEPVIIIVMGVFVGFLVLSILLPILNMSSNI
ncbi:MAG TPA: type II secretion system inner membrane protein GspF [Candidatus Hydrogenedentes bacterium]|nr:type II secretion system inner membrane protein GspF [Candidatus Hydrogenedentota bacterium]HPG66191.1 type II secretion system inner membrane protein GspF [Candidatus Hydrogenedentota bacterium]